MLRPHSGQFLVPECVCNAHVRPRPDVHLGRVQAMPVGGTEATALGNQGPVQSPSGDASLCLAWDAQPALQAPVSAPGLVLTAS